MKKVILTNKDIQEMVIRAAKMLKESFNDESESISDSIWHKVERLKSLVANMERQLDGVRRAEDIALQRIEGLVIGGPRSVEFYGNEVTANYEFNADGAKNAILSDEDIISKLTGNFGDFEGEDIQEVLSNRDSFEQAVDYMLYEKEYNMGNGYVIKYSYYSHNNSLDVTITTPVSWEALENLDNIMDF